MVISTEDSIERNFQITNNNLIDMHVGKRGMFAAHIAWYELGTAWNRIKHHLPAGAER